MSEDEFVVGVSESLDGSVLPIIFCAEGTEIMEKVGAIRERRINFSNEWDFDSFALRKIADFLDKYNEEHK